MVVVLGTSFPGTITVPADHHDRAAGDDGARRAGHHRGRPTTTHAPPDPSAACPQSAGSQQPARTLPLRAHPRHRRGRSGRRSRRGGPRGHHEVLGAARDELDLADREQVEQVVAEFAPDAVVNTAAMTNVDGCERDPERAFAVNALGVRHLAVATARRGAHLVHVSTDYVFDGLATRPYDEWDAVHPHLGVRALEARRRAGGRAARGVVGDRPHVVGVRPARHRPRELGVRGVRPG